MAVSRHLWIGGLPEKLTEEEIRDHFSRFGKIEGVKILPQRFPNTSLAAFIDFQEEESAKEAQDAVIEIKGYEIRTNYKACARTSRGADPRPDKDPSSTKRHRSPEKSAEAEKLTQHDESSSSSESDSSSNESSSSSSSDSSEGAKKTKPSLMLKMTHLPNRSDRVVHDALYHEFYNYSRHPEIRLYTDGDKRFAYIKLKTVAEKKRALKEVNGMSMFGVRLKLTVCNKEDFPRGGRDHPFPPPLPPQHSFMASHHPPRLGPVGAISRPFPSTDDIDPNATRSLFVGNIPKNISIYELRDVFMRFGPVLDVEIKKLGGSATYGFVLFYNLLDAIQAKKCMDGDTLGGNKIRVGFGKGTPSRLLWVDGVDPMLTESQIEKHFSKYGKISRVGIDRNSHTALVQFESVDDAKEAMELAKGGFIGNSRSKIMIDYANKDAKVAFFQRLDSFPPPGPRMGPGMYNMHMGPHNMMMIPGPVPPMMGMGIPPPHRPPMDYYYDPYMRDANFYGHYPGGHYPPPGPGMMSQYPPMYEGRNFDDYEDELRAFSRKRDRDRRREKEEERKPRRHSNSSESDDSDSGSEKKKHKSRSQKTKRHKSTSSKSDEDELEDERSVRKEKKKKRDKENEGYSEDDVDTARQKATQRSKEHRKKSQQKKDKSKEKESGVKETGVKKEQKKNVDTAETSKISKKKTGKDDVMTEPPAPPPVALPSPPPPPPPPLPASPVHSSVTTSKRQSNSSPQLRSSSPDSSSACPQAVHGVIQPFQVKSRSSHDPAPSHQSVNNTRKRIESDLSDDDFTEEISKEDVHVMKKIEVAPEKPTRPKEKGEFRKRDSLPSQSSETSSEGDRTLKPSAPSDDESTDKSKKLPRRYQIDEQGPRAGRRESREYSRRWSPSPPRRRQTLHSPPRDRLSRWKHSPPPPPRSRSPPPLHRRSPLYRRSRSPPIHRRSRSSPIHRRSRSPVHRRSRSPPNHRRSRSPARRRSRSPIVRRRSRSPHHRSPSPLRKQHSNSPPYGRSRTPIQRPARYRHESLLHDARKDRYHHSPSPPRHYKHKSPSPSSHRRRSQSPIKRPYTAKDRSPSPRTRPRHTSPVHRRSVASRSPSPPRARTGKEHINSKRRKTVDKEEVIKPEPPRPRTPPELPTKQKNLASDTAHTKPSVPDASVGSASSPSNKVTDSPVPPAPQADPPPPPPAPATPPAEQQQQSSGLIDLLRRYPVMWQGHLVLKNDLAAVQLHFLSGNMNLAKISLPQASENLAPNLRIAQRMRLEQSQLEGVDKRIQKEQEHCLLLALPCGRDPTDVVAQTQALKNSLILYLTQKQAAGIINVQSPQGTHVLHIFPPCPFTQGHLSRVAPDLLSSASENCHLMIVVATV